MFLGDFEVRYIHGGTFYLDGGAMFGVVPKPLWEKKSPPDSRNRIRLAANSLLVRAANKNILIETGNGTKWTPKLRDIYGVQEGDPLVDNLAAVGVRPDQINTVINTHLHFDHAGGNTNHVGFGNAAGKEAIGKRFLELGAKGGFGQIGIEHNDVRVLFAQFNQRLPVSLARSNAHLQFELGFGIDDRG